MGVTAALRTTSVVVDPGNDARCHVLIRNSGSVVDQFGFTVMGDAHDWTTVKPERANLLPDQEVTVELTFSPPRSHEVLAGDYPFALRVVSREDVAGSLVQEGVVTVAKFAELAAEIVPVTSEGSRRGKHTVAVDNLGNYEYPFKLHPTDPDDKLTFRARPRDPVAHPGRATFVKLKPKPRKYFWRGANRSIPFKVSVLSEETDPIDLSGTLTQKPLVPPRTFLLLSLLLLMLTVLAILLATFLRARPRTMAVHSPSVPPSPSATSSSAPTTPSSPASPPPSASPSPSSVGAPGGTSGARAPVPAPSVSRAPSTVAFTITASAYPGVAGPQLFSYAVPAGATYRVTSLVLRNDNGDVGSAQVRDADQPVADFDLAANRQQSLTFPAPFTATGGEVVTLAVTCGNTDRPCTPSARFTATPLP
jgi:hypothetical protein